jgi:hypothetical protein
MATKHPSEPTEHRYTMISVQEAARRLQISESKIRRNMQADYKALMKDENALLKFKFGRITMGLEGDRTYWINGEAINEWLENFAKATAAGPVRE